MRRKSCSSFVISLMVIGCLLCVLLYLHEHPELKSLMHTHTDTHTHPYRYHQNVNDKKNLILGRLMHFFSFGTQVDDQQKSQSSEDHTFTLEKIIHVSFDVKNDVMGTSQPRLKMAYIDVPISAQMPTLQIKSTSISAMDNSARLSIDNLNQNYIPIHLKSHSDISESEEGARQSLKPNLEDKETILSLALMSHNSYTTPDDKSNWLPIDDTKWSLNTTFGFDSTGLRGHLYISRSQRLLIMTFKGTSPYWLGIGGPTGASDRMNDNLMFSCCCAKINTWTPTPVTPICDCYKGQDRRRPGVMLCAKDCLHGRTRADDPVSYYNAARAAYLQAVAMYPDYDIWFSGHSLGGALASLMGITVGAQAVSFASPGDLMYAKRIGLPIDEMGRDRFPVYHFGTSSDPIYGGRCWKARSPCFIAGYVIESRCHIGHQCTFTIPGHAEDIRLHMISHFIKQVLRPSDIIPKCIPVTPSDSPDRCEDCDWWDYL
jgi:putative lipase involved disintegration of autophagic bodies